MSRISNLVSIRNYLNNSWHSDWYERKYYNNLLFEDLKTKLYLTGIFKRLEIPSSYFYMYRENKSILFFIDLFFLDTHNSSSLRRLYLEIEKYNYFSFLNYYSFYSYLFLQKKRSGLRSKLNLGYNSDSQFFFIRKKNILRRTDSSKLMIYNLFNQKKNRYYIKKRFAVSYNSYLNFYKEYFLDINEKMFSFFTLDLIRKENYNLIWDWTNSWFFYVDRKEKEINNINFFFFSLLSYDQCNNSNFFFFYLFDDFIKEKVNIYFNNSFYKEYLYKYSNKNDYLLPNKGDVVSKFNFFDNLSFNFSNLDLKGKFFLIIEYLFIFYFFFNVNSINNIFYFYYLLKKKITKYFINTFYRNENSLLSNNLSFKRFFYGHSKFLKRVSNFEKLKYKFISKTYSKVYFKCFFSFFLKEIEQTISYYLSKTNNKTYDILLCINYFFKKDKKYPPIRDSKIIGDYLNLRLHKQFTLNRIFYEIRDWQFDNYYNRKYIKNKTIKEYYNFYNEKRYPVLGIRIECSGSYKPGSRKRKKYYGEVVKDVELINKSPNNSFYADLDYYQTFARLRSGSIGIKVWVFFKTHIYNQNKHFVSIVTSD